MLSDCFAEQAVKTKPDREFYLRILIVILVFCLGGFIFLFLNPLLGLMLVMGDIWLICVFAGYIKKEYDYTFTNGGIEIAAIYKRSKRKELMHFDMDQVLMIVPENSPRIANEKVQRKRDYTSKKKGATKVAFLVEINKHKEIVLIEPNERSLNHIKNFSKHKYYED